MEPPERPVPGPLIWDLTRRHRHRHRGVAAQQRMGSRTRCPRTAGRSPTICRDARPQPERGQGAVDGDQARARSDVLQYLGRHRLSTASRSPSASSRGCWPESQDDGSERLICRAMNWRSEREEPTGPHDYLAQRILDGLAQPGVHRALVDLKNWTLLKWLDDPAPFFDWRASMAGDHAVHPDDRAQMARMADGIRHADAASGVLRMAAIGRWMDAGARDGQPRRARGGHLRRAGDAAAADRRRARRVGYRPTGRAQAKGALAQGQSTKA